MLELKKGEDIPAVVGGIEMIIDAKALFDNECEWASGHAKYRKLFINDEKLTIIQPYIAHSRVENRNIHGNRP